MEKQLTLSVKNLRRVDSKTLFAERVDEFMDAVWEEREQRLLDWADEGRSQRWIAKETGRSAMTISNWQKRFDIESSQPKSVKQVYTSSDRSNGGTVRRQEVQEEVTREDRRETQDNPRTVRRKKPPSDFEDEVESDAPPVYLTILSAAEMASRAWPTMKGDYLDGIDDHEIEGLEEAIDILDKFLQNLKYQVERFKT